MYDIGARVYVKSLDRVAKVTERNYHTEQGRRRAHYLVMFVDGGGGGDFLTGSDDLRAADFQCDGCNRWLPNSSSAGGPRDSDGYLLALFCFICVTEHTREYDYRFRRPPLKRGRSRARALNRQRQAQPLAG